ncbi:MAG: insulinase family protein [Oscillospiraceae bacterium]|nr:insulinase family protein [Oscillospiraceae bacterium]
MVTFRRELFPCVSLTAVRTDKFKSGFLSSVMLTQLRRETAAEWAVLPYVLRRGTTSHPTMRALSQRLDGLYGAALEPSVRKLGEIQALGFRSGFMEDRFLPGDTQVLRDVAGLLAELWLSPNTRGGLLLPDYVDSERAKLLERLNALQNDRRGWAQQRLIENMCAFEDYAVPAEGTVDAAESIQYVKLSRAYRSLLSSAPMEFFYCGSREGEEVAELLEEAFVTLPRGEIDLELGTDIRMNAVEEDVRSFTEEMDITQGNLCMGFRLGECMLDPDEAAIRLFNAVFGGGVTSKLFQNIREKMSLCYYVYSVPDLLKGLMLVSAGIDFDKHDAARNGILEQLEAMRRGEITEEELSAAKKALCAALRSIPDSAAALENFTLRQTVQGLSAGPDELAALTEEVGRDELVEIAQSVVLDAEYFLKGEDGK